tara:strand:- start:1289 stop:1513 length:225 start_codon:yes stop_codon:yes gene_type:complete
MAKFEVVVFNEEVRQCVQEGERHKVLSDDWADLHYLEINANDETEARSRIQKKYPADLGYVIESINPVLNSKFE